MSWVQTQAVIFPILGTQCIHKASSVGGIGETELGGDREVIARAHTSLLGNSRPVFLGKPASDHVGPSTTGGPTATQRTEGSMIDPDIS